MSSEGAQLMQFPLKVSLLAMSERTKALIEYYVTRSKNRYFAMASSVDTPDLIIIDHDHPGTAARLAASNWPAEIPLVVLAVGDRQIDGAIMVRKPLDSAGLENAAAAALRHINETLELSGQPMRDDVNSEHGEDVSNAPKLRYTSDTSATSSSANTALAGSADDSDGIAPVTTPPYFRTDDATRDASASLPIQTRIIRYQAKIEQLCGTPLTLEQLSDPDDPQHRFDVTHCLARRIADLLAAPEPDLKAVQFSLPDADIYLFPSLGKVYSSVSLENRRNVDRVFRCDPSSDIKVTKSRQSTVNEVVDRLNRAPHFSFSVQSFCWLGALFFAQGRLPRELHIDSVWTHGHWPNVTRLELIPNCLEIAAAWSEKPARLSQIIERVDCEPRYATSFFNAACTIGLLSRDDANGC